MSIDLNKQWPAVVREYVGVNTDGSNTSIAKIIDIAKTNKALLASKLGLSGTDTVEQTVSVNLQEKFKHSVNIIRSVFPKEIQPSTEEILSNKDKTGAKISRLALSHAAKNSAEIMKLMFKMSMSGAYSENVKTELPKLPKITSYLEGMKDVHPVLKEQEFFAAIVQNFYSEIAAVQNATYGFSIDPFHILAAGSSSSFSSCFTVGRFNSKGPLNIALSPYSGVIYNKMGNEITGRAWVIFDKNFKKFCIMKSYGFINHETIHQVGSWICIMLDSKDQWSFVKGSDDDVYLTLDYQPDGWYVDPIGFFYYANSSDKIRHIAITGCIDAPCIICGKSHYSSTLVCSDCLEKAFTTCRKCGKSMLVDKSLKTYPLCDNCIKKVTTCPVCGTLVPDGKECPKCAWDHTCGLCGKKHEQKLTWYEGIPVCKDCINAMHKRTCECCGDTGMMYPFKGHAVCSNCYKQLTFYSDGVVYSRGTYVNKDNIFNFVRNHPDCGLIIGSGEIPSTSGDDDDHDY